MIRGKPLVFPIQPGQLLKVDTNASIGTDSSVKQLVATSEGGNYYRAI